MTTLEFFTVNTKLAEMAVLASKDLTSAKVSYLQWGLDLMQEIITGATELNWHLLVRGCLN